MSDLVVYMVLLRNTLLKYIPWMIPCVLKKTICCCPTFDFRFMELIESVQENCDSQRKVWSLRCFVYILFVIYDIKWAFLVAQLVKNQPAMWETWVGKIPWRRKWLPTPVFRPGGFHGLYSPWGHKESETTKWLSLHFTSWYKCNNTN